MKKKEEKEGNHRTPWKAGGPLSSEWGEVPSPSTCQLAVQGVQGGVGGGRPAGFLVHRLARMHGERAPSRGGVGQAFSAEKGQRHMQPRAL